MQNHTTLSNSETNSKYARADKTAQYFQIGKSTLWLWVKTLPDFPQPIRIGKRVTLFDLQAMEQYFEAQAQKGDQS